MVSKEKITKWADIVETLRINFWFCVHFGGKAIVEQFFKCLVISL